HRYDQRHPSSGLLLFGGESSGVGRWTHVGIQCSCAGQRVLPRRSVPFTTGREYWLRRPFPIGPQGTPLAFWHGGYRAVTPSSSHPVGGEHHRFTLTHLTTRQE